MDFSAFAGAAVAAMIATSQPAEAQYGHGYETYYKRHNHGYSHYRIPLKRIIHKLRHKGFYDFHGAKWTDRGYKIKARGPRGKLVKIVVNAYTGRIVDVYPIGPRYPYGGKGYGKGYGGHGGYGWSGGHGGYGWSGGHGGFRFGVWGY